MTLRSKTALAAVLTWGAVRALEWLAGWLFGWSQSDANTTALMLAGLVVFLVVIDEIDGMRVAYAMELAKVRVEANREAIDWLEANGGLEHLEAGLDGWNKVLHATVATSMKEAARAFEKRVRDAALKVEDEED
jgi:hypothetical protein